jgi:hypothetical protein
MSTRLSQLIIDLIDAKNDCDEYFANHERNPYSMHSVEDRLCDAKDRLDEYVNDLANLRREKDNAHE